jgi:hypothetical protein
MASGEVFQAAKIGKLSYCKKGIGFLLEGFLAVAEPISWVLKSNF